MNRRRTALTCSNTGVGKVIRNSLPVILESLCEFSTRHENVEQLGKSLSLMETIVTERVSGKG